MRTVLLPVVCGFALILNGCGRDAEQDASSAPAKTRIVRSNGGADGASAARTTAVHTPGGRDDVSGRARGDAADGATSSVLSGRVLLPGGAPAAGTSVSLISIAPFATRFAAPPGGAAAARVPGGAPATDERVTTTTGDGAFSFVVDELPGYSLRASAPGCASARAGVGGFVPGRSPAAQDLSVTIQLTSASRVAGRVVDDAGAGVAGVPLSATAEIPAATRSAMSSMSGGIPPGELKALSSFPDVCRTTSSLDGSFAFDDVPLMPLNLTPDAPGFVPVRVPVTPPDERVEIRLSRTGAVVEGIVFQKETGEGVSSATVKIRVSPENRGRGATASSETLTDAVGSFRFDALPPGNAVVSSERGNELRPLPGEGFRDRRFTLAEKETTTGIRLTLYAGHTIRGTVTESATGEPVEGVEVSAGSEMWRRAPGERVPTFDATSSATTDAKGFYQLDHVFSQMGTMLPLKADKEGYLLNTYRGSGAMQVQLPPDDFTVIQNISMTRAIKIAGTVQKANGDGIAGAKLEVYGENNQVWFTGRQSELSGKGGAFTIWSRPQPLARVGARAEGLAPTVSDSFALMDKPVEGLVLTLTEGGSISGTVVDPDGAPVAGAQVMPSVVISVGERPYQIQGAGGRAESDSRGEFLMEHLPPGEVSLSAQKNGYASSKRETLNLKAEEKRTGVVIVLQKSVPISGKVTTADGKPAEGAWVNANPVQSGTSGSTQTDSMGKYTLDQLTEGKYNLRASDSRGGGNGELKGVEAGRKDADITLETRTSKKDDRPKAKFTGTVVDWKTKQPVTDFSVRSQSGRVRKLDEPGRFELPDIVENSYVKLSIDSPGYPTLEPEPFTVTGTKPVEKTYELGPGATVTGRTVTAGSARPVAGVRVLLKTSQNEWESRGQAPATSAVTGADGRFRLERTPTGKVRVEFQTPQLLARITREASLEQGKETDLGDIAIATGGGITGRVIRQPGAVGVPDMEVEIRENNGGGATTAKSGADGSFSFPGIGVGQFNVALRELQVSTFVQSEGDNPTQVLLELGSGELSGRVLQRGKGVATMVNLNIQRPGKTHMHSYRQSEPDGSYRMPNLLAGEWDASVSPPTGGGSVQTKITVPETGVALHDFILPGGRITGRVEDKDGKPVAEAEVSFRRVNLNPNQPDGYYGANSRTGSDGGFAQESLKDGSYDIGASKAGLGMASGTATVPADGDAQPVTLRLGVGGGTLVSVALSYTDGSPLTQAGLSLSNQQTGQGYQHGARRDAEGTMRIEAIPAGKYSVSVFAEGYSSGGHQVTIEEGKTASIEDVLYPAGKISWRLIDKNGAPARNTRASIKPDDPASIEREVTTWTNHNGTVVTGGLMPGAYTGTAFSGDNKAVATAKFNVVAGQTAEAETVLGE